MTSTLFDHLQSCLGAAYRLERELGGGGMSRVFLAHETALRRRVVVKVLLPELAAGVSVDRFRREILVGARLQHPHIVPLLSAGEIDGLPYFTMPFITGESLRVKLGRTGELPVSEVVRVLRDVVSALGYAHENGVVHRDVKPDNVLLTGGVAVVTDFGVAKALSDSTHAHLPGLTSGGMALGTPNYMAPEQASGDPHIDHRADLYAVGIMAYEMLAGHTPFTGRLTQAVLAAHVIEEPEPIDRLRPALPPALAALVMRCLAKRAADRPQSAADLLQVLDALGTPTGGTEPTTVVPTGSARRVWAVWSGAAGAGAIVGLLALVLYWEQQQPAPGGSRAAAARPASPAPAPVAPAVPISPSSTAAQSRPETPPPPPSPPEQPATSKRAARNKPSSPARAAVASETASSTVAVPPQSTLPIPTPTPTSPPSPAPAPAEPQLRPQPSVQSPPIPMPRAATPVPPPPSDPRPEIEAVIAAFAAAVESRNVDNIRRVYPGMTPVQQRGWDQFFETVRDVKARLAVNQVDVANGAADARVTGTYAYRNSSTGRDETQPVSFRASLRREPGGWRIIQVR